MRLHHILLILLVVAIWGFNFVVIKVALAAISPLTLCFLRFFLASIPAIFFLKRPAAPFKSVALYGLVIFALQFSLLFMGMHFGMTAGLASLLLQIQVFITLFLAVIFLGEKPSKWQIIGALIAFMGIGIVAVNVGGNASFLGFILVIAAAVAWGMGNLISKKLGKVNMLSLVVWGSLCAWPLLFLVAILVDGTDKLSYSFQHLSWLSIAAVMYIVYPTTLFGFAMWNWLLHKYPVTTIAPFTLLVPIFGMLSSFFVLGEPLQLWKIWAALLVITGLGINLLGSRLMLKPRSCAERHA